MNRRKVLTYLLGASFIAGLTSKTFRKKKDAAPQKKNRLLIPFVGTWSFADPGHSHSRTLLIDEDGKLFIDKKLLVGTLTALHPTHFIFTDHYGYELIFKKKENNEMSLYDSADETEYQLVFHTSDESE